MRRLLQLACLVSLALPAFAAGGACPSASNYSVQGSVGTLSSLGVTSCYYISKSLGSDTNSGTTESAPWAHAPGMPSCSNNCSSASLTSGEGFIFRGGDTWVASDLAVSWTQVGTSSHPIYIGNDPTWFNSGTCGSSWCQPILNPGSSAMTGSAYFFVNSGSTAAWVTVDNFEETSWHCAAMETGTANGAISPDVEYENNYFHGWSYNGGDSTCQVQAFGANTSDGDSQVLGSYFHNNVVDGSDQSPSPVASPSTTDSPVLCVLNADRFQNNVCRYIYNINGAFTTISGNLVEYVLTGNSGDHCNMMNFARILNGGTNGYAYNNILRHMECGGGVELWLSGNTEVSSSNYYAFGNLFVDVNNGSQQRITTCTHPGTGPDSGCGNYYIFGNTDSGSGGQLMGNGQEPQTATVKYANNHIIGTDTLCETIAGGITCTDEGNELIQTTAVADANISPAFNQYSDSQTPYEDAPVASTNSTVHAGQKITSAPFSISCTGALAAVCSDTTYASESTAHTVVMKTANARGSNWDIGAYQFVGSGGAISLVQQTEIGCANSPPANCSPAVNPNATFSSAQAAGDSNLVIVEYCSQPGGIGGGANCLGGSNASGPITSVTDTTGNTYVHVCGPLTTISAGSFTNDCGGGTYTPDGYDVWVEGWLATNISAHGSGNVVTAHMTTTSRITGWNVWMFQLHAASGNIVFDQYVSTIVNSNVAYGCSPTCFSVGTTATTTYPNEFFFGYCATSNGTCPPPATGGWTHAPLNGSTYYDTHSDAAYEIVTSTQPATVSFTAGSGVSEWVGMLLTLGTSSSSPNYTLSVTVTGSGSVSSSPSGIASCTATTGTCSASYSSGTVVTLTQSASASYYPFQGWSGACSGSGACSVTMSAAESVGAEFCGPPQYPCSTVSTAISQTPNAAPFSGGTGYNQVAYDTSGLNPIGHNPLVRITDSTMLSGHSPSSTFSGGDNDWGWSCTGRADLSTACGAASLYYYAATYGGSVFFEGIKYVGGVPQAVAPLPATSSPLFSPQGAPAFGSTDPSTAYEEIGATGTGGGIPAIKKVVLSWSGVVGQSPTFTESTSYNFAASCSVLPNGYGFGEQYSGGLSHDSHDNIFAVPVSTVRSVNGTTYTATVANGATSVSFTTSAIGSAAIHSGAACTTCTYAPGDVFTIVQSGASGGKGVVTATSSGTPTSIAVWTVGTLYSTATGLSTTGGSGSGLQVDITNGMLTDGSYAGAAVTLNGVAGTYKIVSNTLTGFTISPAFSGTGCATTCTMTIPGGQGTGIYILAYQVSPAACAVYNTYTGIVSATGAWTGGTIDSGCVGMHLHDGFLFHSGQYGQWSGASTGTSCGTGSNFWETGTTHAVSCTGTITGGSSLCTGHNTFGFNHEVAISNPNFFFFPPSAANSGTPYSAFGSVPIGGPSVNCEDHFSWQAVDANDTFPVIGSTANVNYSSSSTTSTWAYATMNEVYGLQLNGTLIRFGHNYVLGSSTLCSGGVGPFSAYFNAGEAIGVASQDGTMFAFSSDMLGQLGPDADLATRADIFVVGLDQQASVIAVPAPPTAMFARTTASTSMKGIHNETESPIPYGLFADWRGPDVWASQSPRQLSFLH